MAILIGSIMDLAVSASYGFFMAKFLEVQYEIPVGTSSLLVGKLIRAPIFQLNLFFKRHLCLYITGKQKHLQRSSLQTADPILKNFIQKGPQ